MALPVDVAAIGWVPFAVVLLCTFIFSWLYMRYFQSVYDAECSSTLTSILALSVSLLTTLLVPVDIFIISYMKTSDGEFKSWANDSAIRTSYENGILYGYYTLYGIMILFLFFIIPFVYFYYEENDEELFNQRSHLCVAFRYTIFFVLLIGVLLLLGAVIPFKDSPPTNSTNWERIEFLVDELGKNKGEDALSFILSVFSMIGMLLLIIYTGYGMASMPIGMIKGSRSLSDEQEDCHSRKIAIEAKINAIKDKYRNGRPMKSHDRRELDALEESEHLIQRQTHFIENEKQSLCNKCAFVLRPFQIVFGIIFALLGLLIFLSLLITSIDKAMHSLGYQMGFTLEEPKFFNPIDQLFTLTQQVFPLDYLLFSGIVVFFIVCSLSGITQLGIWFLWVRMFRIRPHRTRPQGLLLLCVSLMFIILALNVVLHTLAPQYTMYGSQHYKNSTETVKCSTFAPFDDCVLSRMSSLLIRFFYKAWFFGVCYYVQIWIFLIVVITSSVISIFRKPQSSLSSAARNDDFEESDEEMLSA